MTTDELRVKLAEKLGWRCLYAPTTPNRVPRGVPPSAPSAWIELEDIPDLASLVRTAEQGLSEEQLGRYAATLCANNIAADPISCISFEGFWSRKDRDAFWRDIGRLITASDDDRAKALLEVM